MSEVDRARVIASIAHRDQKDKAGKPYLLHLLAVAEKVETEQEKVVALLHDTVEDSHITVGFIRDMFGKEVAEAVDLLTHKEGVDYFDYIRSIKANPLAKAVKLADLSHNLDTERLQQITEQDKERLKKYGQARQILLEEV